MRVTVGVRVGHIHSAILQLLLTRPGNTRMDGVGIVIEFYIAPLEVPS